MTESDTTNSACPEKTKQSDKTIIVPEKSAFYVRGGLDRALSHMRDLIDRADTGIAKIQAKIEEDPDNPSNFYLSEMIEQYRAMQDYNRQWLREAIPAYSVLPNEIRPLLPEPDEL